MCEYVLRAFLKKMYFVLLFNFWFCNFARERQRQREKFESIDRATDKKKRLIRFARLAFALFFSGCKREKI